MYLFSNGVYYSIHNFMPLLFVIFVCSILLTAFLTLSSLLSLLPKMIAKKNFGPVCLQFVKIVFCSEKTRTRKTQITHLVLSCFFF